MGTRLQLQTKLKTITTNVYFQPPETIKLTYPCIIYMRKPSRLQHADDRIYNKRNRYEIMLIDKNPDTVLPDTILNSFTNISNDTFYSAGNLHHYVFTLYY